MWERAVLGVKSWSRFFDGKKNKEIANNKLYYNRASE